MAWSAKPSQAELVQQRYQHFAEHDQHFAAELSSSTALQTAQALSSQPNFSKLVIQLNLPLQAEAIRT